MSFAELCVTTNFSFLRSGSHPEEMVEQACALGLVGIGVADRNTLAGVVRAHVKVKSLKEEGKGDIRLIVGTRLVFRGGTPDLIVYPKDRAAYANLTRLLTIGNRRAPKGECWLDFADYLTHAEGLQTILIPAFDLGETPEAMAAYLTQIKQATGAAWLAASFQFNGEDRRRIRRLKALAMQTGARLIATTEPLMHHPDRRPLLDVVTCIREKKRLTDAGAFLSKNAERYLKPEQEMLRLYRDAPEAVAESARFLEGVSFSMDQLRYEYPEETSAGYANPQQALEARTWAGAEKRYPEGVPQKVRDALVRELGIVGRKQYAPYFLTVADIVEFARSGFDKDGRPVKPILCQGRGSAANSAICYCLGVTSVDPAKNQLLFDRFVSEERNEPPDIDVDFEHERREEVIQYIYKKYTRERAGLAATLICYRGRSAVREVAKVFGYSEDAITSLSKMLHWWSRGVDEKDLRENGFDVNDKRLMQCMALSNELQGFPRHLSQHVGGFVITREQLHDVVPIQNAAMDDRTVVEWNKDDLEDLGILKVDVLGLGMLTCLQKAFDLCAKYYPGEEHVTLTSRTDDERVYKMLHRADSIGVFQVESRAQMSMLPRLQPKDFYDLVIEVAIVRPGPIQGGMVHPYLKRRQGIEKVTYPSEALREVLKRTLGVPLFQEQAMQIAIVAAGFSPPEADKLRRAMATFRRVGTIGALKDKFISGMIDNGYERAFAEASFSQIEGFGEYGFPESHAASFAILVYASSWLKCYYPDVFAAALLNAQPMGFYAPAQIIRDAADHGVEIRPIDINHSDWDNTLEPGPEAAKRVHRNHTEMVGDIRTTHAMRMGFRQAKGLDQSEIEALVSNRRAGYDSVRDVWLRSGLSISTIEHLADIDAFRSLGLDRREALWAARGLNRVGGQEDLPLFAQAHDPTREPDFDLPSMPLGEHVVEDYRTLGLSLKTHPVALIRDDLTDRRVIKAETLRQMPNGQRTRVAGLVLVRQRPGTASGVIFMTLEDETGIANIVVWPKVFEEFRRQVLAGRLVAVDGPVQSESGVIHVVAERIYDYTPMLAALSSAGANIDPRGPTDEPRRGTGDDPRQRHPRNVRISLDVAPAANVMPKGRNFH
ncbi:error-prone DNA polymerase [Vitreimonas flagellata]|uniref:error-prone DNA polymerase n=1 Tax=Vitreimonas flagellata TaxID=2560861 RepID=UPI00107515B2|nr:error-prone DNA polymerase [Vitreimonas flagellata]